MAIHRLVAWAKLWWGGADRVVLLALLTLATSIWVFLSIADDIAGEPPGSLDVQLLRGLRTADDPKEPLGPHWLPEAARDVTSLGGYVIITLVTCAVIGFLVFGRHFSAALLVLGSVAGGGILSLLLKDLYARPRPDLVPHLTRVSTASFPSGHAMLSAIAYLTLGALLARLVKEWWAKIYFVGVAVVIVLLVGMSRAYLGVHYPTDIAAGWAAGIAWANLCWLIARYLQRKGTVEMAAD